MWSGPRNISTTIMRAFENRPDCAVIDEPLYAHYLHTTGDPHPMQSEILAALPRNWREAVRGLTEATPASIFFQKHMCHHLTADVDRTWFKKLSHFFLIREPARMVASYADRMEKVTPEVLGLALEAELFDHVHDLTGAVPAVVDAADMLADPRGMLTKLCDQLEIPFLEEMLSWPQGPRASDGVWAPHWYKSVESSSGFRPQDERTIAVSQSLRGIVAACQPHYDHLYAHRLTAD